EQQRERFMAMILVTHDLGVVANRADEIAVMYAGQIVEKAPAVKLFSAVRMPYTEALLNSIPKLSDPSHTRLLAIGGRPPDLINPPSGCRFSPRCPYVQDKCIEEAPPLVDDSPDHQYRCWFPVDVSVASPSRSTEGRREDASAGAGSAPGAPRSGATASAPARSD
ncbi:MAG: oligopeptide/dipeptide ABC transporter ATP-binding protein, partial [Acidimicrobiales bacterium]